MKEINKLEMLNRICKVYLGYRERLVATANDWISLDGIFMFNIVIVTLSELIPSNILNKNYDSIDELFSLIEEFIEHRDSEVEALITTELLEGMMNYRGLDKSSWKPLLGLKATEFCDQIDTF